MSTPVSPRHADAYRSRRSAGRRGSPADSRAGQGPLPVTDGIWAVPVPLRGSPLVSVTVFLVETSDGLVLIDAGYDHPSCWDAFTDALTEIGHDPDAIRLVLLTHNHPDHVGFADRVRATSGARVVMSRDDDFAHQRRVRGGGFLSQLHRALEWSGAPAATVEEMHAAAVGVAHHREDLDLDLAPTDDTEHTVGDVTIRGIRTPGHTYGHTAYLDISRRVVFTGDTMMAQGPTQLAIPNLPDDDPAGDLLASLDRLRALADDGSVDIACPAHQFPYRGVADRARRLADHHRAELDAVDRLLDDGATAWEIAPRLPRAKPWNELGTGGRRFALIHTLSLVLGARARRDAT